MKLISIVTHRGEREAVLAVLEDGSSFRAPVFDDQGELIECYEGDMEKLGELVSGFVTGGVLRRAKRPGPDDHPPGEITPGRPGGPAGPPPFRPSLRTKRRAAKGPDPDDPHRPGEIPLGEPGGPVGVHPQQAGGPAGVPDAVLLALSKLARACVAMLKRGVLADALAS